jgi:predicted DNA-binding protein (UPF0278 family)
MGILRCYRHGVAGLAKDVPLPVSAQIENEFTDRMRNAFEKDTEIVENIRRALNISRAVDEQDVWRAFAHKIIRELRQIEMQVTERRCREVRVTRK